PRIQQVDGVPLIKEMVRDGLGHTILPLAAVRDEVARGSLAFHPIDHDPLTADHAIASRRGVARLPFVTEVRAALREVMTSLARSGAWPGATVIAAPPRLAEQCEIPNQESIIE